MLILDQLKRNDRQLRVLALIVLASFGVLFAGLWWVQVVCARSYQENLEKQSFRTVRIPAARGKILDRHGVALAENRPTYEVSLYLEDMRKEFDAAYFAQVARARAERKAQMDQLEHKLHRTLTRAERRQFTLSTTNKIFLRQQARYGVASNAVIQVSQRLALPQPLVLDAGKFERHYETRLVLPFPVYPNLTPTQIARFEEQTPSSVGLDLEVQPSRVYPYQTTAAHLLGWLKRNDASIAGEEAFFSYRLPDYEGLLGIEAGYDGYLHGRAGGKSVLVNNVGYRQTENVWSPAEPGTNVVLTIDLRIQRAAERALPVHGPITKGAVVVMDVESGDILALASSPTLDPNLFAQGIPVPPAEAARLNDPKLRPQINRATQENYAPGSIFKPVVAMACLENGLNPLETIEIEADPDKPGQSCLHLGRRKIRDTAPPGPYDLRKALKLSSNAYFITIGLRAGVDNILKIGQRLHFGEPIGLQTHQETKGILPTAAQVHAHWFDGDTANLSIGQGQIAVTPLQMAVMTAAIANGGKVLWPRLVQRLEPQDRSLGQPTLIFPGGRVRDELGVKPQTLITLREAMLADVEDPDGTGVKAAVPGWRVCGKTGTAQVQNERGLITDHITWFVSFAPYEHPRYAVVVMIESGGSGGATCAPVAGKVFLALQESEKPANAGTEKLARAH